MSTITPAADLKRQPSVIPTPRWLWAAFVAACLLYCGGSLILWRTYLQPSFDLGIYDQSLWLAMRDLTFNTIGAAHVVGAHFSPILWLLAPISLIPGGAVPELILQGGLLATAVFPAYRISRWFGRDPKALVAVAIIHPAAFAGAWYGFRPWNLAAPLVFWASWWLLQQPTGFRLALLGLAGTLIREDIGLWIALLGLILVLIGRMPLRSWLAPAMGLGIVSFLITGIVLPRFSPVGSYYFTSDEARAGRSLSLGLVTSSALIRSVYLYVPLGVRAREFRWSAAAPLLVPIVGLAALGGNASVPGFHYEMLFVPLLVLVTAASPIGGGSVGKVIAACAVIAATLGPLRPIGPLYGPNPWEISPSTVSDLDVVARTVRELDHQRELRLSVPDPLAVHFTEREQISVFPYPFDSVELGPAPHSCPEPDIVVDDGRFRDGHPEWDRAMANYGLILEQGPYRIYARIQASPGGQCVPLAGG